MESDKLFELVKKDVKIRQPKLPYHNYKHICNVVSEIKNLDESIISNYDKNTLLLAAYYHDIGYVFNEKNHEEYSSKIASERLKQYNVEINRINQVEKYILDTKFYDEKNTEYGKFLADADVAIFGYSFEEFLERTINVKKELYPGIEFEVFLKGTIDLIENHSFETNYFKQKYSKQKENNIKQLRNMYVSDVCFNL